MTSARQGKPTERKTPPRVKVAVSPAMASFRATQEMLNRFWQTSELAYAFMLAEKPRLAADRNQPAVEVLGYLESSVWFPNNQGRLKLDGSIGKTMDRVEDNTVHAYRTTLISFYSAFEAYLTLRAKKLRQGRSWGPFVTSLSHESLRLGQYSLPVRAVIDADIVRLIRNLMVHEKFAVPTSTTETRVAEWKKDLRVAAKSADWPLDDTNSEINDAFDDFIGKASENSRKHRLSQKKLPIELFYMLYAFTSLDNLAFAIEEALLPNGERTGQTIQRLRRAVRRSDLIVSEAAPRPART